jgi:hypothetical protein
MVGYPPAIRNTPISAVRQLPGMAMRGGWAFANPPASWDNE